MDTSYWLQAALLGLVEGLTEFLPVSSTGHLILFGDLIGFDVPQSDVFEVVIQLGAILAVCVLYARRLWNAVIGLPTDPAARRFALTILLGFLPAAVLGLMFHKVIKTVLFSPWVVSVSLIVGGFAILLIERIKPRPRYAEVEDMPLGTALGIGFCQALAMIPGVSRSGATIMGALMFGVNRPTAAEYSFFLAIPTMLAASVLDLYKAREGLTTDSLGLIAVGFVVAFLSAIVVVRALVAYVQRHGFAPFAYYRIVIGAVMLGLLSL
ncbi:Undecaprenyl-diphosphatase 2 [Rhodovastum atsumiense]|uniref:Undecaprenyl-diphosphatase n=1 Tax=Rhodovastum atsumiense TaxID=504468 RepID=A0A5M6IKR9_9PROT|nr:undecaprenyl-diphosphate phosphatase [Rhodovastum atsumiense]KAA5608824.1 undecaprenyl-diphosphate phosphatase [Rhodovastum atsumiense]CAH2600826.1 Undecaprenyl-diphosphatase 2 [Rhodovastum atsumiense]